jgi:hypothetical protein
MKLAVMKLPLPTGEGTYFLKNAEWGAFLIENVILFYV